MLGPILTSWPHDIRGSYDTNEQPRQQQTFLPVPISSASIPAAPASHLNRHRHLAFPPPMADLHMRRVLLGGPLWRPHGVARTNRVTDVFQQFILFYFKK